MTRQEPALLRAWRQWPKGHFWAPVILIALAGLVVRLHVASDPALHQWDERHHALVAKHLSEHPLRPTLTDPAVLPYDHTGWSDNHVWLHKPPMALWLIAASLRVLGTCELAVRLPSVLLSTLAVLLTAFLGLRLFGPSIGLWAAAFHSGNGFVMRLAGGRVATDHVDSVLVFFVELGVVFALKYTDRRKQRYLLLLAVSVAAAVLTKWAVGFLALPVAFFLLLRTESLRSTVYSLFSVTSFAVALVAPWNAYIHANFPTEAAYAAWHNMKHLQVAVEGHKGYPFYHFHKSLFLYGPQGLVVLATVVVLAIRKRGDFGLMALTAWAWLPMIVFSWAPTKLQAFTFVSAPAIFLVHAYLLQAVARHRFNFRGVRVILLIALVAAPAWATAHELTVGAIRTVPYWRTAIDRLDQKLGPKPTVVFNAQRNIEIMFYTDHIAYRRMPNDRDVALARRAGYPVAVIRGTRVPTRFTKDPTIKLLYW